MIKKSHLNYNSFTGETILHPQILQTLSAFHEMEK